MAWKAKLARQWGFPCRNPGPHHHSANPQSFKHDSETQRTLAKGRDGPVCMWGQQEGGDAASQACWATSGRPQPSALTTRPLGMSQEGGRQTNSRKTGVEVSRMMSQLTRRACWAGLRSKVPQNRLHRRHVLGRPCWGPRLGRGHSAPFDEGPGHLTPPGRFTWTLYRPGANERGSRLSAPPVGRRLPGGTAD